MAGTLDRRTWLGAAAAGLTWPAIGVAADGVVPAAGATPATGAGAVAGTVPGVSGDALGNEAVALSPQALLQAYIRLRGSLDGSITAGWLDSLRYVIVDGVAHPFCRVIAGALSRYERKGEAMYEATTLEVTHYCDFQTGEPLETLTVPVTNRVVKVPPFRIGPAKVRFAVRLDEREAFSPKVEGKGSENFAPLGEVRLRRAITDPRRTGGQLHVRHEEIGGVEPKAPGIQPISYREWTIWRGPAEVALDPRASYCPSELSYTAMTSWRPWMQMGDLKGHTLDSGRGGKARQFASLPANYLELTARRHPDVVRDPEAALLGPRG